MPKQFVRNFGHVIDSAIEDDVLVIYEPGNFPAPATTERVIAQLASLFIEHRIDRQPVLSGSQWSGISGELLIAPNAQDDWQPVCNFDFPSTNDVRRINAGGLAWERTLPVLGADSLLGFRLIDRGHGFLPLGAYLNIWGAGVEFSEDLPTGGGTIIDGGGGGGGGETLTAAQIVSLLEGLTGSNRLDASAIDGLVSQSLTASQIVTMLQGLTGSDRLDASAIEGLNNAGQTAPGEPLNGVQFNQDGAFAATERLTFQRAAIPLSGDWLAPSGIAYSQSSLSASATAAVLNDGLLNTGGISTVAGAGQWIKADLGNIKAIDGIMLGASAFGAVITTTMSNAWIIQVSQDDQNWTQVGVVGVMTDNSFKTISFDQVQARYVRILNPSVGTIAVGTSEFRVRGTANQPGSLLSLLAGALWVGHTLDAPANTDVGVISASVALNAQAEVRIAGVPMIRSDGFYVGGARVVGGRSLGWTAGTGTPLQGSFAANTATLQQTAQRVLAIEQALRTIGLIN